MQTEQQSYTRYGGSDAVNPTLVAQLASRIYNEVPGASLVPKHETDALLYPPVVPGNADVTGPLILASPPTNDPNELLNLDGINGISPHHQIPANILGSGGEAQAPYLARGIESAVPLRLTPDASDLGYYFLQDNNTLATTAQQAQPSSLPGDVPPQPARADSPARARTSVPGWPGDGEGLATAMGSTAAEPGKYSTPAPAWPGSSPSFIPAGHPLLDSRGIDRTKCLGLQAYEQATGAPRQDVQLEALLASFSRLIRGDHPAEPGQASAASVGNDRSRVQEPGIQKYDTFDVYQIRKDFPVLHQQVHGKLLVWFDNAATTQKPQSVIDAISRFYARDNSNIHRGAHSLAARATDAYEDGREKVRRFLGAASTSEIIFVRGTTEGINLVAQTYGRKFIQPGDEILLSVLEHHANIVPWQLLAKEKGAIIRVIPVNDKGEILMDEYTKLLNPRTRLVSLAHVNNSLGTLLPVKEMIHLAKKFGARVLVDGAQSVAHTPVNVQDLDADFYVFSGHKIFSPTGIGAVYGKRELLDIMPPWHGGGNMIRTVTFEETTFNEAPAKFEAGTPNVADAVGLGAALDYVNKVGIYNIARYEHLLTEYAREQLSPIPGLCIYGHARERVSVVSFVLKDVPTEEVGKLLDQEGIAVRAGHHCAQPSLQRFGLAATVRPSLSFYNTREEVDRLVAAVRKIVKA